MNWLIESFAWCMLQVTLFMLVVASVYRFARRPPGNQTWLLAASLLIVGVLTLASVSPWPNWNAKGWRLPLSAVPSTSISGTPKLAAPPLSTVDATFPTVALLDSTNSEIRTDDLVHQFREVNHSELAASVTRLRTPWWRLLVVIAWGAAVFGLIRAAVGLIFLRRYCRDSVAVNDVAATLLCEALCRRYEIKRTVELRESESLQSAATVGWLEPMILLPPAWRDWSPSELRAVLAHELAHVRERHFPTWLASQMAVVCHYYHPLVHWLSRRLRLEQEIVADRLAAEAFGDRRQYTSILASLALKSTPQQGTFAGVGLFMSRPLLMRRIAMLRQSSESSSRISRTVRGIAVFAVLLAAVTVAGLRAQRSAVANEAANPVEAALPDDVLIVAPPSPPVPPTPANPTALPQPIREPISPAVSAPVALPQPSAAPAPAVPSVPGESIRSPATATFSVKLPAAQPVAPGINFGKASAVTALIQLSRSGDDARGNPSMSDAAWKIKCNTQIALLQSYFVLQSAIKDSEVADLPLIKAQSPPIEWLRDNLRVGFYPDTEIMYLMMPTNPEDAEQSRKIVDAVVHAYMNEVVFNGRQRAIAGRDALDRSLKRLNEEITQKMSDLNAIASELGSTESGVGQVQQQIDMRRLDRVEAELMRLEDESLQAKLSGGDPQGKTSYYEQRIERLQARQDELMKSISARGENSVDFSKRKSELEQLQKVAAEMSYKLEMADIDSESPDNETTRVIQPAVISGPAAAAAKSP